MKNKTALQAMILGFGQITGKIISLIFLFRFSNDLGSSEMTYYTYAFIPFSIFADLSAFGFIPGTSKATAQLIADKEDAKANDLLRKGTVFSLVIGGCFFIFLFLFSNQILSVSLFDGYTEDSFNQIKHNLFLASLSLFVIPLSQFYKGFLQGHLKMYPSCLSIVFENLTRLILYILIVGRILDPMDRIHSVFLIHFSAYFVSLVFLFGFVFSYYRQPRKRFHSLSYWFKITIPYGMTTMFFTIYQLVDSITLSFLLPTEGIYTAYMFETVRLIFLPIVLAQSLGGALNPKVNYLMHEQKAKEAASVALHCLTAIIYILIPLVVAMKYFSDEIYHLFYKQENGSAILYHISDLIFFFGLYKVLIGISFGLPKSSYMIFATIVSGIAKYILNVLLIEKIGYLGAIYSTEIAISICIFVAYFVLYKEGISLFVRNLKSLFFSLFSIGISIGLVILFRSVFFLGQFPSYYSVILYSVLLLGIYSLFFLMFRRLKQVSKEKISA